MGVVDVGRVEVILLSETLDELFNGLFQLCAGLGLSINYGGHKVKLKVNTC